VFPSWWEGLPLTVLEAMAAGAVVVASDLPGHREILEDGVQGRIAPPGDDARFAAVIEELLADSAERQRLVAAAHERVRARFSVGRMVEATIGVYRAALADIRVRAPRP
jgi:glycosyltransferase involved in cell wall biosynthesis